MKRLLKYLLVTVVILLFLGGAGLLVLETGWGKRLLRDAIVDAANSGLSATLRIGRLEGDLFRTLVLHDILIVTERDTLARIPLVSLRYDLGGVFRKHVTIEELRIDTLLVSLRQAPDGRWNFSSLIRERDNAPEDTAAGGWDIIARDVSLGYGRVLVTPNREENPIPRSIDRIEFQAGVELSATGQTVDLRRLSFSADGPALRLDRLSGTVHVTRDVIEARQVLVETARNRMECEGTYSLREPGRSEIRLRTDPLDGSEFSAFLPAADLPVHPAAEVRAVMTGKDVTFAATVRDGPQTVEAEGTLRPGDAHPGYSVIVSFDHIDTSPWTHGKGGESDLSGRLTLVGTGFTPADAMASLTAEIAGSRFQSYRLDRATIRAQYRRDDLEVEAAMASPYGNAELTAALAGPPAGRELSSTVRLSALDLARLGLGKGLDSRINLVAVVEGVRPNAPGHQGTFRVSVAPTQFRDIAIDTLFTRGRFSRSELVVDTLHLVSDQVSLDAAGSASDSMAFRFRGRLHGPAAIRPVLKLDAIAGDVSGVLTGRPDSLCIRAVLGLDTLSYLGLRSRSAAGHLLVRLVRGSAGVDTDLRLTQAAYPPITLDSASLRLSYRNGPVDIETRLYAGKGITGDLRARIVSDTTLTVTLPSVRMDVRGMQWSNGQDTVRIIVDGDVYRIDGVRVHHGEQRLLASGVLRPDTGSAFQVRLENCDLSTVRMLADSSAGVHGMANVRVTIEGGLSRPRVHGSIDVQDLEYFRHRIGNLTGTMTYADSALAWQALCAVVSGDTTVLEGLIPTGGSNSAASAFMTDTRPAFIRFHATRFDLAPLRTFVPWANTLKGILSGDLTVTDAQQGRTWSGAVRLDSAEIRSTSLGIAYDSISARVTGRGDSLRLDHLVVRSGEGGRLTATGSLLPPRGARTSGDVPIRLDLRLRDFVGAKTRDFEVKTDGDLSVERSADSISVRGNVDVLRCRVWLPAFLDQFRTETKDASLPLLVAATRQKDTVETEVELKGSTDSTAAGRTGIGGRVKLHIPRNVWLQSPEVNVELSGDLDLVPRGTAVELFGYLNVERGSFNLYGKKFTFVNGRADFEGGTSIDPRLDAEVKYSYRGPEKNQEEIRLVVTGSASKPSLEFRKNNERITNADAVSYVMFGRSLDELSQDQKSTIAGSTNDLAQSLASSVLSNQLSNTVGKSLGLDVIEVDLQDNWRAAYLTAGKYVSEKLYVRYTKGFQQEESGEAIEEVALEYEPFRPFMLQLIQGTSKTTGLNLFLILK